MPHPNRNWTSAQVTHPAYARFGFALACAAGAIGLRWALEGALGTAYPFITCIPAIILAAVLAGGWAGGVTTVVSCLAVNILFIQPHGRLSISRREDVIALAIVVLSGVLASAAWGWVSRLQSRGRARRQALAAAVREREARLNQLYQTMRQGVIYHRPGGGVVSLNAAAERILGRRTTVGGALWTDFPGHPALREDGTPLPLEEHPCRVALETRAPVSARRMAVFNPVLQAYRWLEVDAVPVLVLGRDTPDQVCSVFTDITESRQVNEDLQRSEDKLRGALQRLNFHMGNSPLAVIEFDRDLRLTFWSGAAQRIFGWETEEVLGRCMWDLPWVFEEDAGKVRSVSDSMTEGRAASTVSPNRNRRKDGTVIWCEWYNSSLTDPGGKAVSIFSLVQDVTERVKAENALRESEERFRAMADGTPQMIWVTEPGGRLRFVNRAYSQFFGVSLEHLRTIGWDQLVHPDDSAYFAAFAASDRDHKPFHAQARVRRQDGAWRWVASHGEPRVSPNGEYAGMAGTATDITEHRNFEAQLEALVQERTRELREVNEQLNAFCYSIAHDLKAPLRAQAAFATILEQDFGATLGATGLGYARRIGEAAERQRRLVDDLLSHISVSRAEMPLAAIELRLVVEQARSDVLLDMQQKGAQIELGELNRRVVANAASLHLVVVNLLSNAMKFVAPGTPPRIRVWAEGSTPPKNGRRESLHGAGDCFVRVCVEDNGIGIAQEHQQKVFGVFQRLHTTESYPGTGIGLAIVKKAVERMGGQVGLESTPNVGSRFWVELPEAGAAAPRPAESPAAA